MRRFTSDLSGIFVARNRVGNLFLLEYQEACATLNQDHKKARKMLKNCLVMYTLFDENI